MRRNFSLFIIALKCDFSSYSYCLTVACYEAAWPAMNALQRALPKLNARVHPRTLRNRPQFKRQPRRNASSQEQHGPSKKPGKAKDTSEDAEPVDIPSSLWYRRLGPITDFFSWFDKTRGRRPLTVQVGTTLVTYLCGDLLAQEIGGEPYNPFRTMRMLTIGAIASIPGYKW